jgi:hypothetical protein
MKKLLLFASIVCFTTPLPVASRTECVLLQMSCSVSAPYCKGSTECGLAVLYTYDCDGERFYVQGGCCTCT